jgi:hypothetical protein
MAAHLDHELMRGGLANVDAVALGVYMCV